MKKIRDKIQYHIWCADRKWKALPKNRQRLLTKLCFAGYALLTVAVLINICMSTGNKTNTMLIDHINTISDHTSVKRSAQDNKAESTIKK
ncbi:hypothetical protein SAMN05444360_109114 [Chryseobacterium carnipullorum]|uniref:hypothetical protein n=1 Tax=Chryseobacterium carnipullorum TaxID=1124835 RepID=UPI000921D4C1|nr:hypothetical protein [Chryseobacterium carnipullorum]SHM23219.1 hypothetical protein SAMN05444360_109114 [Chryseobacterium carnipullorum]